MDDQLNSLCTQDDDSCKSAFASIPMALLARQNAFSTEGKVTRDELRWMSICSGLMHHETMWSRADDSTHQVWRFALLLISSVCQKLREQWNSVAQWASGDEKAVIATFLDASVIFAFRACTSISVSQDGFHLLSVLCCDECKEPCACPALPEPLKDPKNPINAFVAASPLGTVATNSAVSTSAPLTSSIEQVLAQSMGSCAKYSSLILPPDAAQTQSFVSRCAETAAKHRVVEQLLERMNSGCGMDFTTAALAFLVSAKACLAPAHVPLIVNLVSALVKQAQQFLGNALSCGSINNISDCVEQKRVLTNLQSALQALSLAEGAENKTNFEQQSASAGWSILATVSRALPPLGQEGTATSVTLSAIVLEFVDAALLMLEHASAQQTFDANAVYKLVQVLVSREKPYPLCATPAVTPSLHTPPAPPPAPPAPPLMRGGFRSRIPGLRRRLEEVDAETPNRNSDNSLCGSMFDEPTPKSPEATPTRTTNRHTWSNSQPEAFSDRVVCHAFELLARELVKAPLRLKDPELVHFLIVLSHQLRQSFEKTSAASVRDAWCTLLQQLSASPLFPEDALEAFVTQGCSSPEKDAFFARWWLSQVVRSQRFNDSQLSAILDCVGKKVWTQSLQKLTAAVASTSENDPDTLPSFEQSVLLILVWRTGLTPQTRSVIVNTLLHLIGSHDAAQSSYSCLATTRVLFLAQAVLSPSVLTDQEILAIVQQKVLTPSVSKSSSPVLPERILSTSITDASFAAPVVHFAWKPFAVPACAISLPLSNEEAVGVWYQTVLESFTRASSLPDGVSAAFNESLWSFLWCLHPPTSFYEQLKDPAFLLTFGVNDATTYLLSWLAFICFSSSDATLPDGCPSRSEVPLSAHMEACLVLLSSLACKSQEQESHTFTNNNLALAVVLFLYSCLPPFAIEKAKSVAGNKGGKSSGVLPLCIRFKQLLQETGNKDTMTDSNEQHSNLTEFPFYEVMQSVSVHNNSTCNEDEETISYIRANMASLVGSVAFLVSFLVSRCNDMLVADIMKNARAVPSSISPVIAEAVHQSTVECVKPLFAVFGMASSALSVLSKWDKPCCTRLSLQDSPVHPNPAALFLGELLQAFSSSSQPAATLQLLTICALQLLRCVTCVCPLLEVPKDAIQAMVPAVCADGLGFTTGVSVIDTLSLIVGPAGCSGIVGPFIFEHLGKFIASVAPLMAANPAPGIRRALCSCVDIVLGVVESSIASPLSPALQEFYFGQDSQPHILFPLVSLMLSSRDLGLITHIVELLCHAVDPERSDKLGKSFAHQIALALASSEKDALSTFVGAMMIPDEPFESGDRLPCSIAMLLSAVAQADPGFGQQLCCETLFPHIVPLALKRSASKLCGYIPFVALIEQIVVRNMLIKPFLQMVMELCASSPVTPFSVNLFVVLQRMLTACSGTKTHPKGSSVPAFNECSCESLMEKYTALVQKVAPWWQWGPQNEPLAADNAPLSTLCTFSATKKEYVVQHWYHCYTCDLTDHSGMCSICATTCHRNHDTYYQGHTNFYCDCGANERRKQCQCLKARTVAQASALAQKDLPKSGSQSNSKADRSVTEKSNAIWLNDGPYASLTESELSKLSHELHSDASALQALVGVLGSVVSGKQQSIPGVRSAIATAFLEAEQHPSTLRYIKAQSSHPFISSTKQVSLVSRNSRIRESIGGFLNPEQREEKAVCGILGSYAIVTMQKGVSLFQVESLVQKPSSSSSSKTAVALETSFDVVGLKVRKGNGLMFVVYGLHECVVCVLDNGSECSVAAHINIKPTCTHPIRTVYWLPETADTPHPCLVLETESCIQVFDLFASVRVPLYHFVLPAGLSAADKIFRSRAVSLVLPATESVMSDTPSSGNQNTTVLFVCLTNGQIFAAPLEAPVSEPTEVPLVHRVLVPPMPASFRFAMPLSVFECTSLETGNRVCIRVCSTNCHTVKYDVVVNNFTGPNPEIVAEKVFCTDVPTKRGRLVSFNTSYIQTPEALLLIGLSASKKRVCISALSPKGEKLIFCYKASSRPLAGMDVVSQPPFDRATVIAVAGGDGAVSCVNIDLSAIVHALDVSKQNPDNGAPLRFSKRFFEHATETTDLWTITSSDIKDCAGAKTNLTSSGKSVASPNNSKGFAFTINLTDDFYCIVGVIAGFGFASKSNVPRSVTVANRRLVLKPRTPHFYEIPLTIDQVMRSPGRVTIEVSECPNDTKPVIDKLRVFVAKKTDLLPSGVKWPQPELFSGTPAVYQRVIPQQFISSALRAVASLYSSSNNDSDSCTTLSNGTSAVLDALSRFLAASPCGDDVDVIQDVLATFLAVTRSPEESQWLVDRALLMRIVRNGNSSPDRLLSNIGILHSVCTKNPSSFIRFVESENADPLHAITSPSTQNNKLTEAQFRSASKLFSDAVVALVRSVIEPVHGGDAAQEPKSKVVFASVSKALRTLLSLNHAATQGIIVEYFGSMLQTLCPSTKPGAGIGKAEDVLRTGLFSCDVCGQSPIVGKHWRCRECEDFDLCDKCHSTVTCFPHGHLSTHAMTSHDDGQVITCAICGKSMLATRWMTCPKCSAIVCHMCSKKTHTHCSDAELVPETARTNPSASFLGSLLQTAVSDNLDDSGCAGAVKCLEESKRPFVYEPGCAFSHESPGLEKALQTPQDCSTAMEHRDDDRFCPSVRFMTTLASDLLSAVRETLKTPGSEQTLFAILQIVHVLCVRIFDLAHNTTVVSQTLGTIREYVSEIGDTLSSAVDNKCVVVVLLFIGSLFDALKDKCADCSGSLAEMVSSIVTPSFLGKIRVALHDVIHATCETSAQAPMSVDKTESEDELRKQRTQALLALLDPRASASASMTISYSLLVPDEYCPQGQDIFGDHKNIVVLALTRLARVTLQTVKPAKIEPEWKQLAGDLVCASLSRYVHKEAKHLARVICGDEVAYHMICDERTLDTETKWLTEKAVSSAHFTAPMSSPECAQFSTHISVLVKLVSKRDKVWRAYCSAHPTVFHVLFSSLVAMANLPIGWASSEFVVPLLKLLNASLSGMMERKEPVKSEKKVESTDGKLSKRISLQKKSPTRFWSVDTSESSPEERKFMSSVVVNPADLLVFAEVLSLRHPDADVRCRASQFLLILWSKTSDAQARSVLSDVFAQALCQAPSVGRYSNFFIEALRDASLPLTPARAGSRKRAAAKDVPPSVDPKTLVSLLRTQNRVLVTHPNASLYGRLGGLVDPGTELKLEVRPCFVCNTESAEFKTEELKSIIAQTRATPTALFHRLDTTYMIGSFRVALQKRRATSRTVKVLNIYTSARRVADVIDLRDKWDLWKRVQSVRLAPGEQLREITFTPPVPAANLCVEVAETHDPDSKESLVCPRCSNRVPDRHGVCSHCGENAYQCRNCRYIPYENFNAFFCPQCGACRESQLDVTVSVCKSFVPEPVESDEDLKKATECLEKRADEASKAAFDFAKLRNGAFALLYKL